MLSNKTSKNKTNNSLLKSKTTKKTHKKKHNKIKHTKTKHTKTKHTKSKHNKKPHIIDKFCSFYKKDINGKINKKLYYIIYSVIFLIMKETILIVLSQLFHLGFFGVSYF